MFEIEVYLSGYRRRTDEGSVPEIAQYVPYYLPLNVFTASKGSNFYIVFTKLSNYFCYSSLYVNINVFRSIFHYIFVFSFSDTRYRRRRKKCQDDRLNASRLHVLFCIKVFTWGSFHKAC